MDVLQYLTIPYLPFGRTPEGVDCWGLICLLYRDQFGLEIPTYENIDWSNGAEVSECIAQESTSGRWTDIPAPERKPGDVVTLKILGLPWHVGMVLTPTEFIHAHPVRNVCIERFNALHWKNRILSYHRLIT